MIGRIEDRMPFSSVMVPAAFRRQYPELVDNLQKNADRLTTVIDWHYTLRHILALSATDALGNAVPIVPKESLFAQVLSESRSCFEAKVPEYYCPCYTEMPVSNPNQNEQAVKAAAALVLAINDNLKHKFVPPLATITNSSFHCSTYKFDSIESASLIENSKSVLTDVSPSMLFGFQEPSRRLHRGKSGSHQDFMLVVKVKPNGALFEAKMTIAGNNGLFSVVGQIQRVNRYGEQSWCISGSNEAKKFCNCEQIPTLM